MDILTWIALGLVAGLLAKWIMPGPDRGGVLITILLGIGGAMLGGFIGRALGFGNVTGFNLASLVLAVGGAALILIAYRKLR
jgi:uncharacterized membrane protein YeaQ/YmgE (transglycosylase-associated protein family)